MKWQFLSIYTEQNGKYSSNNEQNQLAVFITIEYNESFLG